MGVRVGMAGSSCCWCKKTKKKTLSVLSLSLPIIKFKIKERIEYIFQTRYKSSVYFSRIFVNFPTGRWTVDIIVIVVWQTNKINFTINNTF